MSQSPDAFAPLGSDDAYLSNFDALGRMIGRGLSFSGRERNCLFFNTQDNRFAEVAAATGFDFLDDGRAIGVTDWDGDGDLDIWLNNRTAPRVRLLENRFTQPGAANWIAVRLIGTSCNRDAIGARVTIQYRTSANRAQRAVKTLRAGDSFLSQSSKWVHFGLGQTATIDRLSVRWPTSRAGSAQPEQVISDVEPGYRYEVTQIQPRAEAELPVALQQAIDEGSVRQLPIQRRHPASGTVATGTKQPPSSRFPDRVFLTRRRPLPASIDQLLQQIGAKQMDDPATASRAVLLTVWATWCPNCVRELSQLTQAEDALRNAGLNCVALSADHLATEGQSRQTATSSGKPAELLEELSWPFAHTRLTSRMAAELTRLKHQIIYRERPLTLPFSVLLDSQGQVAAIYREPIGIEQLMADLDVLDGSDRQIASAAFPFPGRTSAAEFDQSPLLRVMALAQAGELRGARRLFTRLKQQGRVEPGRQLYDVAGTLAALARREQQFEYARQIYQYAVRAMPRQLGLHIELAVAYSQSGDHARGIQILQNLASRSPQNWRIQNAIGRGFERLGDFPSAIQLYQKALESSESNATVQINLAAALQAAGRTADAIETYENVLANSPDSVQAKNNLAWTLATADEDALRDPQRALRLATTVVDADGGAQPSTLDTLATAQLANGNVEAAGQTWKRAIRLATQMGQTKRADAMKRRLRKLSK